MDGQTTFIRNNGFQVYTASGSGAGQVAKDHHTFLPLSRELSPLQDIKALWVTYRYLRKLKPAIVHTHTPKAGLIGMLAAWLARVPIRLHTVAGLPEMEASGVLKGVLRFTERLTSACAINVYPNSKGLLAYMQQQRLAPPAKLKVIAAGSSNGIDTAHFQSTPSLEKAASAIRDKYSVPKEALVFIFIGRLDNHKGIRELCQAFEQLNDENSWLFLVGPVEKARGGLDPDALLALQEHRKVVIPGFQEDVRSWLLAADVLVFPSYREGFPNVPLQAAAMGLPSIATDINGCNEIIETGVNGLLIPKKDATALQRAMQWMIDHPEERKKMGEAARPRIVELYDRQKIWKALEAEYHFWLRQKGLPIPEPQGN